MLTTYKTNSRQKTETDNTQKNYVLYKKLTYIGLSSWKGSKPKTQTHSIHPKGVGLYGFVVIDVSFECRSLGVRGPVSFSYYVSARDTVCRH